MFRVPVTWLSSLWYEKRMLRLSLLFLALSACASAQPPAGPKHVPSATPQSATDCPKERDEAQERREALLGNRSASLSQAAGRAVLAHAQCEAKVMDRLHSPTGSQDQILAGLKELRLQSQNAVNLYRELQRYDPPRFAFESGIGEAQVRLRFAELVATVAAPADLDEQTRAAFQAELADALAILQHEAAIALQDALDRARELPGPSPAREEACALLHKVGGTSEQCPN